MKIVYESADGKQFKSENECLMHEAALGVNDFMLFDEAGVPITTLEDCPTSPKYAIVFSNPDVAELTIRTHFGGMGISGCGYYIRKNGTWINILKRITHYRDQAHKLQSEYLYLRALGISVSGELASFQPTLPGGDVDETKDS